MGRRRRGLAGALALTAVWAAAPAPAQSPTVVEKSDLGIAVEGQLNSEWCVPAAVRMALRRVLGEAAGPSQCAVAMNFWRALGVPGDRLACVKTLCASCLPMEDPARLACAGPVPFRLCQLGCACTSTPAALQDKRAGALSWDELVTELSTRNPHGGRPILHAWRWTGARAGGHAVVLGGHARTADASLLWVLDPWPPCHGDAYYMPYEAYVGGEQHGHAHSRDFWGLSAGGCALGKVETAACASASNAAPGASVVTPSAGATTFTGPANLVAELLRGPTPTRVPQAAWDAARRARELLLEVASPRQLAQVGFASPSEARDATLGAPLVETVLEPDAVTPRDGDVIFPLLVRGRPACGVFVRRIDGAWTANRIGASAWTRLLEQARVAARPAGATPESTTLWSVPSRRRYFMAHLAQPHVVVLREWRAETAEPLSATSLTVPDATAWLRSRSAIGLAE
jgi:hypothetical protein